MTTSPEPFRIRIDVRISDIDPQLHVTSAAYLQYADHARFECVQAAGVSVDQLLRDRLGPVNLEAAIKYHHELRAGDCVDVTCAWVWGGGKTYRVENTLTRTDGELVATLSHVCGLLNLDERKLVADPAAEWAARAKDLTLLGLEHLAAVVD